VGTLPDWSTIIWCSIFLKEPPWNPPPATVRLEDLTRPKEQRPCRSRFSPTGNPHAIRSSGGRPISSRVSSSSNFIFILPGRFQICKNLVAMADRRQNSGNRIRSNGRAAGRVLKSNQPPIASNVFFLSQAAGTTNSAAIPHQVAGKIRCPQDLSINRRTFDPDPAAIERFRRSQIVGGRQRTAVVILKSCNLGIRLIKSIWATQTRRAEQQLHSPSSIRTSDQHRSLAILTSDRAS
ncbi:hypothetical protein ACLOJK_007470, partial [Asimina triloba]